MQVGGGTVLPHALMMGESRVLERRRQITAYLSRDAYIGWRSVAESTEVSVAALLEALGRRLAETSEADLLRLPMMRAMVEEARTIDTERRERKGPRRKRGS